MTLQSKLIATLIGEPEQTHRLTVLDVGPADAETVTFFSQYKCRLHFLDLFSELVSFEDDEITPEERVSKFSELFDFPADTRFDICLFWDFFSHLDAPTVCAFSQALSPYLHEKTRAHGLGTLNAKSPLLHQSYGIKNTEQIRIKPPFNDQSARFTHPQAELRKLLSGFDIRKGILMPDGQLEILFNANL